MAIIAKYNGIEEQFSDFIFKEEADEAAAKTISGSEP